MMRWVPGGKGWATQPTETPSFGRTLLVLERLRAALRPMLGPGPMLGPMLGLGLMLGACSNEQVAACHADMQASQKALLEMDKSDIGSVKAALGLIEHSLTLCEKAQRAEEVANLRGAKREVAAHVAALEERASRPERRKLTAEELAELQKKGDPECPKGQAYQHAQSKELIKCVGKQLIEMPLAVARQHFDKRGFKLSPEDPGGFKAEFGAQAYEFRYAGGPQAPSCLTITGKPGVPWQEIVSRTTGVHPDRLEQGKSVMVSGKALALRVGGEPSQWTVHLGQCDSRP